MRYFGVKLITCILVLFMSSIVFSAEKEVFYFKKQPEIQNIKPKKPVKIKLKRSAKDGYTWEIAGDNVEEIIRTDRRLRKMLNINGNEK